MAGILKHLGWILGILLIFGVVDSIASKASPKKPSYVLCRSHKIVRTIRVEESSDGQGRCETFYTKSGVDRSVGSGINLASCNQFMNNIRNNLEAAAWRCKDITANASISAPAESNQSVQ